MPGLLVAISIQLKPHESLIALPLFLDFLARREWRRAVWMALPIAASIGVLLSLYKMLYGSPLTPPQPFLWGNPLVGFRGLFFSAEWGLFVFCPVAALALVCWPAFVRKHGRPAVLMGSGFVLFALLMISYVGWHGSYGPRHLVPALPLLLASLDEQLAGDALFIGSRKPRQGAGVGTGRRVRPGERLRRVLLFPVLVAESLLADVHAVLAAVTRRGGFNRESGPSAPCGRRPSGPMSSS